MLKHRKISTFGTKQTYVNKLKAVFGSSLIGYWPLWEASGTVVTDISGNGRNGAYGAAAKAPTLGQPGAIDGTCASFDGGDYADIFTAGLAGAFSNTLGTLTAWVKPTEAAFLDLQYRQAVRVQADTNNRIGFEHSGINTDAFTFIYRAGSTFNTYESTWVSTHWGGWMLLAITWNKTADRVRAYINGVQTGADMGSMGVWNGGALASGFVGSINTTPSNAWLGWIQHVALGNAELSAASILQLSNKLKRKLIVFEGDSRTVGSGATNVANAYPSRVARKLNGNWNCVNVGDSGHYLTTMISEIATELNQSDPGLGRIAVLWGGVNDNDTATNMHNSIAAWCTAARAMGYKVVICTEIDCQDIYHTNWHNTNYQALNTLIRNNYTAYADGLADLGNNANLQDATNITYFDADKLHLTNTGYTEVATAIAAAVNAL